LARDALLARLAARLLDERPLLELAREPIAVGADLEDGGVALAELHPQRRRLSLAAAAPTVGRLLLEACARFFDDQAPRRIVVLLAERLAHVDEQVVERQPDPALPRGLAHRRSRPRDLQRQARVARDRERVGDVGERLLVVEE